MNNPEDEKAFAIKPGILEAIDGLDPHGQSLFVSVTREMLDDPSFDWEAFIVSHLMEQWKRRHR